MNFKKRFEGRTSLIGKTGLLNAVLSLHFPVEKEPIVIQPPKLTESPQYKCNRKYSVSDANPDFLTPQSTKQIEFPSASKLAEYYSQSKSSSKKHCMLVKLMEKKKAKANQLHTIDNSNTIFLLPKI